MKKSILILILLQTFSLYLAAQIDTSQMIYSWKLDPYYSDRLPEPMDTNLTAFQLNKPTHWFSVSSTGNKGAPTISNIFSDRNITEDFTIANVFYPFMKRTDNTVYMNTHKPFTKLTYWYGGALTSKEETFDAFHSQNISPVFNAGLHFTTQDAHGQYNLQRINNNSFRIFSSYTGKIYSSHSSFNINRIKADENGGVLNDTLITSQSTYNFTRKEIQTLFSGTDELTQHDPDVYHDIRNINFFTIQEASFRKLFSSSDTTEKPGRIRIFYPKLAYIFTLDRSKITFTDEDPSVGLQAGLYPDIYVDTNQTFDSVHYWKMQNTIRLQFQGRKNNHYFIDISYEAMNYTQAVHAETVVKQYFMYHNYNLPAVNRRAQLYNTYLSSGFSRIFANSLKLNVYGRYYLSGYQSGDYQLSGKIQLMIKRNDHPVSIDAGASNELLKPGFLYGKFISNNFIWNRSLKQTNISNLSSNISLSSNKFAVHANYYLLHNMIYFNTDAIPSQFDRVLSVLSVVAEKELVIWKWHNVNKLAFQQVSEPDVLSLPTLALHSSNYLEHEFYFGATEGRLLTMIGFDLFYNTSYYVNAYMPSLAVFHQQKEKQLGNYPYIDVFLNVKLKRACFFVKYEHLNSGWMDKNFFTTLHYPKNQQFLKLGLSWTFYD